MTKRYKYRSCYSWKNWVVPSLLRERPIHRWLVFPHSFTDDIVKELIDEWSLGSSDLIVDPFIGAGTTLLASKEAGVPAIGFDLSPLAILASNTKVANYCIKHLEKLWRSLKHNLRVYNPNGEISGYPELIQRALPGKKLATLHYLKKRIDSMPCAEREKGFFLIALISLLPKFSNAIATGGWLSWEPNRRPAKSILKVYNHLIEGMLDDIQQVELARFSKWKAKISDARELPLENSQCSAVITSPPYPNRHDYTRIFGVELMFTFLNWEQTRNLRYQTFESHPESKPTRPEAVGYIEPRFLSRAIRRIGEKSQPRIVTMLHGYFLDLFLNLKEVGRILKKGGHAAFVVGNAQYSGVPLEVDKATAAIAEQCNLACEEIRVVRVRGNSAQQMKIYGRNPSRESVVILERV